jgi:penicillin-binding protein 1A
MRDQLGFSLDPADEDYAPLALGQLTHGATVREMTSAFTMFPNNGFRVELRSYTRVYDHNGNIILDNNPQQIRAINEASAYWMTNMLVDSVIRGTGGAANIPGFPTAGKTGTSTDSHDRWFVGFTPHFVAGVWTGFDTPARMSSVGNPAAQIFRMIMEEVHQGLEPGTFGRPDTITLRPVPGIDVEDVTIRGVDLYGNLLYEEIVRYAVGREFTSGAPAIEGYVLISEPQATIVVTSVPRFNIIEFVFEAEEEVPDEPDYPEDPEPPEEDPYAPPEDPNVPDDPPYQFPPDDPLPPLEPPDDEPPVEPPAEPPETDTDD